MKPEIKLRYTELTAGETVLYGPATSGLRSSQVVTITNQRIIVEDDKAIHQSESYPNSEITRLNLQYHMRQKQTFITLTKAVHQSALEIPMLIRHIPEAELPQLQAVFPNTQLKTEWDNAQWLFLAFVVGFGLFCAFPSCTLIISAVLDK